MFVSIRVNNTTMDSSDKTALLGHLVSQLRTAGNWCGETHVQKTVYVLQTACQVPMGYSFVLYKHGPYSFDLKLDTSRLLGRRMLKQEPSAPPYGPRLRATTIMSNHVARHHEAICRHSKDIARVVQFVGSRGVAELERLSTALYVTVRNEEKSIESRAKRIHELKPHVSVELATDAVKELDASSIFPDLHRRSP